MNQGIYYLYEYETGQRKRNLGFLQISHQYRSCMMTLHLKSLPLSPGTALELHGFYNKDRDLIHAPCAILNYSGGSIATRLSISESLFPCGKSFSGLEGFLLLPEGKAEPLFWAASVNALPVGFSLISAEELSRSPEEVSPVESSPSPEEVSPVESSPSPEEVSPVESSPSPEEVSPVESSPSPEEVSVHAAEIKPEESETVETTGSETAETSSETVTSAPTTESVKSDIDSAESAGTQPVTSTKAVRSVDPGDSVHLATTATAGTKNAAPVSDSDDTKHTTSSVTARKITRAELSTLPRKFWSLANNSFLLHGYYNYNHLLLVEEDGHIWLGVPGIYDAREARAADLFGFPQFTSSYVSVLELGDDERNNDALFGHWCRYLATK
ncbi:DUF6128 domain-containing protein [[Ruminococcus] lactaris]|uniref:DUF6128 domain-containing protein n=1 Tax=[Ruminococcus] lactaris TaxID=46228 RepID=UPI00189D0DBE|nr:DUF6128 domain-containing protein [[Ruminococcus] lactaris]